MLCAQWTCHAYLAFPFHVPPARLLVRSRYRFTCFPYCTDVDWRLICLQYSLMPLLLLSCRLVYAYHFRLHVSLFSLSTRLPSCYSWTLTRCQVISLSCIFVLISRLSTIYTGWRWDCSPSSIYFATTLKVWPARSHKLSSSSLVRWPRLLLCDLREFPSVHRLPVVKSSLRSVLWCTRNRCLIFLILCL